MSGPMILGVLSDTHLYRQQVPERVLKALEGVDLLVHAGDIVEMAVLEELERLAPLVAVAGNMDHGDVRKALPEKRVMQVAGYLQPRGGGRSVFQSREPDGQDVRSLQISRYHRAGGGGDGPDNNAGIGAVGLNMSALLAEVNKVAGRA
jgi:hypothetical protein